MTLRPPPPLPPQVGYAVMGIKALRAARVGDTLCCPKALQAGAVTPLPGFKPAKARCSSRDSGAPN